MNTFAQYQSYVHIYLSQPPAHTRTYTHCQSHRAPRLSTNATLKEKTASRIAEIPFYLLLLGIAPIAFERQLKQLYCVPK